MCLCLFISCISVFLTLRVLCAFTNNGTDICLSYDPRERICDGPSNILSSLSSRYYSLTNKSNTVNCHIEWSNEISLDSFTAILDRINSSNMLARLQITNIDLNNKQKHLLEIGKKIDKVLTNRPWWNIRHENHGNNTNSYVIYLERYPDLWRPYLEYLAQTQYMTLDKCSLTPLVVVGTDYYHPGWSYSFQYAEYKQQLPFSILYFYWPFTHYSSWIDVSIPECINISNKWECAFLPLTNCTLPVELSSCRMNDCAIFNGLREGFIYTNSSLNGKLLCPMIRRNEYPHLSGRNIFPHFDISPQNIIAPKFLYQLPYNKSIYKNFDWHEATAEKMIFLWTFLLRPNVFYRDQIKHYLHDIYARYPKFTSTSPCVVAHIRRADRTGFDINMTEWCYNATHDKQPNIKHKLGCRNLLHKHKYGECEDESDLGCDTVTPFGSITLESIISKVGLVINPIITNIVTITDDPIWLQEQIDLMNHIYPQWNFIKIKNPKFPKSLDLSKIRESYEIYQEVLDIIRHKENAGYTLFSSFKLVQQCNAFIGHLGSAASILFYGAMCVEHAGLYGICPPKFDYKELN